MSFRTYLRWDGCLAVGTGLALLVLGLAQRREAVGDAVFGGAIMVTGTGLFMLVRHRLPFRAPGGWYSARALAAAEERLPPSAAWPVLAGLTAATVTGAALVVGLSAMTGFWLTYMDVGVWAVAIGAVKLGPGAATVAREESRVRCTYRVARRSLRGGVQLTVERRP